MNHFSQMTTLLGTVTSVEPDQLRCDLRLRSGDTVTLHCGAETTFSVLTNIDGASQDRVPEAPAHEGSELSRKVARYLRPLDTVYVRAVRLEHAGKQRFDARAITRMHSEPQRFVFEDGHWWLTQTMHLANAWLDDLFGDSRTYREDDFSKLYRTNLNIYGGATDDNLQAMPTLSRLIYGLSSSYLLTGDRRYRLAAAAGIEFQRSSFRILSHDGQSCIWAYGRRKGVNGTVTVVASENGDDAGAISMYEQIYGLAGLAQYFRITGDPVVLDDIRRTVRTFNTLFLDRKDVNGEFPGFDGYFTHLDPATLRPDSPALGRLQSRKNWNSIGDHIPAYLINLILALDPLPQGADAEIAGFLDTCREMLDRTTRLILEKFPASDSLYVNERFFADWTPEHTWGWQQDRAVVGHNYKIAWNLTRVAHYLHASGREEEARRALLLSERLAKAMLFHGADVIRGGCFDAVQRHPSNGQPLEFPWGNTKDFWQQEQAILANLILHGQTGDPEYLEQARAMSAFWNMFFLDRDNQGVFFRVSEDGLPIVNGSNGNKAQYAVAGYHSFELNYLAHVYTRAYVAPDSGAGAGFCLYFHPSANTSFRSINVLPDFVKPGSIEIESVSINGRRRTDFDPNVFQLPLSDADLSSEVVVRFRRKS
ncbi:AGE family epimerase/isomerase [Pyxidicoccus parkwayensis]|uniref:AGE family epimerase/isomerase n=1 Tax=Pyxidicoccus parkwayensis TaxID=2813578 RepID=A0ABX7NW11_9BACT|nr:AGE family epimerase/isomerase [Pyxidicoccus parkwaysis]QSQ22893.1 AGE family epimerase/isomerase [Pyxidicoccus parkwaysis]